MDARRLAASVEAILDRAGDGEPLGGDSTSDRHALAIHQLRQLVQRVLPSAWAEGHMLDTGHGAGLGGALVWMGNARREVDCPITMLPAGIFIRIMGFCDRPGTAYALGAASAAFAMPQPCLAGRSVLDHATARRIRKWGRAARVTLRSHHGKFVTAQPDGTARNQSRHVSAWAAFDVRYVEVGADAGTEAAAGGRGCHCGGCTANANDDGGSSCEAGRSSQAPGELISRSSGTATESGPAAPERTGTSTRQHTRWVAGARARERAMSADGVHAVAGGNGGYVALRSARPMAAAAKQCWLSATDSGTVAWTCAAPEPGDAEMFEVFWQGGQVALRSKLHNRFVSAQPDGSVVCDREWVRTWESFTWTQCGAVALRSMQGMWLSATADGGAECVDDAPQHRERTRVVVQQVGDGLFALKSHTLGTYLSAKPSGTVEWRQEAVTGWETLYVVLVAEQARGQADVCERGEDDPGNAGAQRVALKCMAHGRFLSARPDGSLEWISDTVSAQESFTLYEL